MPTLDPATVTVVVVVRDPDSANEFHTFPAPAPVVVIDVDLGYRDLGDPDEFAEWADALYTDSIGSRHEVCTFIDGIVTAQASRYGHPNPGRPS